MPSEWTCNFCDRSQISTEKNSSTGSTYVDIGTSVHGDVRVGWSVIRCLNPSCNQMTWVSYLAGQKLDIPYNRYVDGDLIFARQLMPETRHSQQPDYIAESIKQDYYEACLIRDHSPKASATLARRCIQGMIRDFCGISEKTLDAEIRKLRKAYDEGTAPRPVSEESIVAIDKVRQIGNIGAHMERDINVIVDVDPDEAQVLIDLIELLFAEWYVAREKRRVRLEELSRIADEKQAQRALPPPSN